MELTKAQLKEMRLYPCVICGRTPTDVCHIKTKKTGGTLDDFNLISFCRDAHQFQHRHGWERLIEECPIVAEVLSSKGWEIDQTHGRFRLIRSQ